MREIPGTTSPRSPASIANSPWTGRSRAAAGRGTGWTRGSRPRRTRTAAELIPGARLELLEGHGHWSNRQSPARVNALIAEFLRDGA